MASFNINSTVTTQQTLTGNEIGIVGPDGSIQVLYMSGVVAGDQKTYSPRSNGRALQVHRAAQRVDRDADRIQPCRQDAYIVTTIQIVVLAIVQGLTEFLPISSSGHLVLVPYLVEWQDQGLAFDVAVHFGSLLAVVVFFRDDIAGLLRGGLQLLGGNANSPQAYMALAIALGTIPAAAAGLLFASWIEENLRDPSIIVYTLAGYGILMAAADRYAKREKSITDVRIRDAIVIGVAQALALIPGTSRSGVTITAGRLLGFERQDAARFSFLLSAPVILLATVYKGGELVLSDVQVPWGELALGVLVSAVVAYLSIEFFMRFVTRIGLAPFAIYRLALAALIAWMLL